MGTLKNLLGALFVGTLVLTPHSILKLTESVERELARAY